VLAFSNPPARGIHLLVVLILILVLGLISAVVSSRKASVGPDGPGGSRSTPWERVFLLATPLPLFVMWALPALLQLRPRSSLNEKLMIASAGFSAVLSVSGWLLASRAKRAAQGQKTRLIISATIVAAVPIVLMFLLSALEFITGGWSY
jgi:hypothetical protein